MELSFESDDDDNGDGAKKKDDVEIEIASQPENVESIRSDKPPKKRKKHIWHIERETDDVDGAIEFLDESGFVCHDYKNLKIGQKFYFRCRSMTKERDQWCAIRYTLFFPSNSLKVQILKNQHDHDHDALLEGTARPISYEMAQYVKGLFECGTEKTSAIIAHIDYARKNNGLFQKEPTPGKRQIEYLIRKFRSAEAPSLLNLGDLIEWCNKYSQLPSDVNEAFVISQETSLPNDPNLSFRFVLSTRLLLEKCLEQKTIAIDATYKLNWLDYPLMVYGTVDREKNSIL